MNSKDPTESNILQIHEKKKKNPFNIFQKKSGSKRWAIGSELFYCM